MQAQPLTTENATRTAPLCNSCAHLYLADTRPMCNHPGTPRHVFTGLPVATIVDMRARYQDSHLADLQSAHCGLKAALYEPASSASKPLGEQQVPNGGQAGAQVQQPPANAVLQGHSELVGGTCTNERCNQLGVCSCMPSPEGRID